MARLFLALRDGLRSLDTFYRDLEMPSPDRQCNRGNIFFPHVLSYRKTDRVVAIKYIAQLGPNDKSKAVFKGEDSDGQRIVVKFTDRYNAKGHRLLAQHSFAPQLLYISSEDKDAGHFGYRVMVVMEFLDGRTAEDFDLALSKPRSIWSAVRNDVKLAIETLHKADLVFGDLRTPNIMIVNGRGKLVDFDWCGRVGQDRYPRDLNDDIKWPRGVERNGQMQKDHDLHMIEKIFGRTSLQSVIEEEK